MVISFEREKCSNLNIAESREWLITNGIGGYASGTITNLLTRRYHGLLIATLQPPLGRTLLLTKLDETAEYKEQNYPLYCNRWADGTINPEGYKQIENFHLEGTIPVWKFTFADAVLEKRIWMEQGENTTYIHYNLLRGSQPLNLAIKALINHKDHHHHTHANNWDISTDNIKQGVCIKAFPEATPLYLLIDNKTLVSKPANDWYYGFNLAVEKYRGQQELEDHLHAVTFNAQLEVGKSLTIVASTKENPTTNGEQALASRRAYEQRVIQKFATAQTSQPKDKNPICRLWKRLTQKKPKFSAPTPEWINQLVLAANQFIVDRKSPEHPDGKTIIAGYHWFEDWGRDTMISLPGLTLCTGQFDVAKSILLTFAKYVDRGMLPNRFPDGATTPDYNTVDATLWYFEAIRAYYEATEDDKLLVELFPVLAEIIDYYRRGTRYNIQLDADDGLIYAGEPGSQITWMDAKVGDWVVTPRIGKPIEISALWYNALQIMDKFAQKLGKDNLDYERLARLIKEKGFARFWNQEGGYCYDVLDTPNGNDASLRSNQIFALSLPPMGKYSYAPLLTAEQEKQVMDICTYKLLTPYGLRSLASDDPKYKGVYGGDIYQRDGAYHQGTVWGWLIGAYVTAHLRIYNDPVKAEELLKPMTEHLMVHGVGSISEIFDGNEPITPRGCIAQAWSVAEVLRAWSAINQVR
ncbi:MAG: glycogen debranching protein [Okeania sp. SIO3I5]|uniref:amylo-alpha-1,6-glucosidase n=1 Tax=Okeania sp. SIO3I5 TaxID=2607805 RepID=UPI0013B5E523|nr:amylo-alpha-1,6-glucosidase [Okeania sp. SIO3I5]NEQ35950.1 glycogen debranching protein [Okeania sp. SIO3I5]